VVMSRFDAEQVLAAIDRYKVQGTMLVPTHFRRMLALPDEVRARYQLGSLTYVTHTGAACPREVKQAMIEWWGPVFLEAYGGTECGNLTVITSQDWLKKPGSVGRAAPPYEGLVISEDGEFLGPNQEGRLYFRDTTGRGISYFNDPEKTAAAHFEPGVFTLGEIGYYDEDGYCYITDRFSDMVVSGGVNIYPAEIEKVLVLHPDVLDVAVVGVPNEEMGEEVRALVIPRDAGNPPSAEALLAFCRECLARYKCPASFDFVSDVGRNVMGKINKSELRRRYWSGEQRVG
jgi:long-chain acyl-CoA synthetase